MRDSRRLPAASESLSTHSLGQKAAKEGKAWTSGAWALTEAPGWDPSWWFPTYPVTTSCLHAFVHSGLVPQSLFLA